MTRRSRPVAPTASRLQRPEHARRARAQRRQQREEHSGSNRYHAGEREHGEVDADLVEPRDAGRGHRNQHPQTAVRERDAAHAAGQRDNHALDQQELYEPTPPRSEGDAYRRIHRARFRSHLEQVREVAAPNQQHERHRAEQHQQRASRPADHIVLERADVSPAGDDVAGPVERIADRREAGHQPPGVGSGGFDGGARRQAGDEADPRAADVRARRIELERDPDVDVRLWELWRVRRGRRSATSRRRRPRRSVAALRRRSDGRCVRTRASSRSEVVRRCRSTS